MNAAVDARITFSHAEGVYVVKMVGKSGKWVRVASAGNLVVADDHARALGATNIVATI